MKVNRNFKCYILFLPSKNNTLHEIIKASSISIMFVEFSFKPVYPTMVVKILKFMEN